jgi:N6-adenosine-specific RNA methylase IME4
MNLVKYDAACRAIAEARRVDEVKDIRDRAEALRLYGRQAKNKELEVDAAEIRLRAERRLGEMLAKTDRHPAGRPKIGPAGEPISMPPRLADLGIDKKLSARAQKIAAVPAERFEAEMASWRERVSKENERVTMDLIREGDKAQRRDDRELALAEKQKALPDKRYGVIYADPPWRFDPYSRETGMDRAADNHYPTMSVEEIVKLPVDTIAAPDCILFLWATAPMLPKALRVMEGWGFSYKSQLIWVKDRLGTGYWARNRHELLLIGTKGSPVAPAPGAQPMSVIVASVEGHSVKPEIFRQIIEGPYPNSPKVELFARRGASVGWDHWGNEVEVASA